MAYRWRMDNLLDIPAAAEVLGVSERHIRNLVYKRQIPYVKVGRLVRFKSADLTAWIDENTVSTLRTWEPPRPVGRAPEIPTQTRNAAGRIRPGRA